ncbi:protein BUNDLE SHEATH DEFECTIVE 2, chloroplastic-like [Benincasa hispida]|uniref:protein BUNDLE SHEATH DEFECTIVE 2, chloroplastic-like n=1 Tax=Benincasa hispida TaxID=102211 RepID=UPI0019014E6B|nr:protein BUNDLE SHEATH DEFECTIVE 2, chloroplastic-like [Benincasa hispida]
MAFSTCSSTPICSFNHSSKPNSGVLLGNSVPQKAFRINKAFQRTNPIRLLSFEVKASDGADSNQTTKYKSIVCTDCDGNGAVLCSQCKGTGVNSVDHFNGQFKAGSLCWLCRGKRDILCGGCNGAGFVGGFMSTADS